MLAKAIQPNKYLEVFDISFNSIGGGITINDEEKSAKLKETVAKSWADCFRYNRTLIHVDISHNNLKAPELATIAEGLRANHTILGIHLIGNEGEVDANGFVVQNEAVSFGFLGRNQIMNRISVIPDKATGKVKSQLAIDLKATDNCWICEGWQQVTFEFTPGVSNKLPDGVESHDPFVPIYLHLDQDDFRRDLMLPEDPDDAKTKYRSTRMVAPG